MEIKKQTILINLFSILLVDTSLIWFFPTICFAMWAVIAGVISVILIKELSIKHKKRRAKTIDKDLYLSTSIVLILFSLFAIASFFEMIYPTSSTGVLIIPFFMFYAFVLAPILIFLLKFVVQFVFVLLNKEGDD